MSQSTTLISDRGSSIWVARGLRTWPVSLVRGSPSAHSESYAVFVGTPDRAGRSRACFAAAAGLTPYQPARPRTTPHLPTDRSCIPR
jgi:hypothetical protein